MVPIYREIMRIESDSLLSTRGLVFVITECNLFVVQLPKTVKGYTYGGPVVRQIAAPVSYV